MKFTKFIYTTLLFVIILNSCKKADDSSTSGTPNSPSTPSFSSETVKAFFFTSIEPSTTIPPQNLTVLEPNGTIRWKRNGRGGGANYNMTYSNGIIYSSEPDGTGNISNFYAYNINSGVDVWSKVATNEFYFYPIVRNDTLFCSTKITTQSTGNITAFNAQTGALYWRKNLSYPYYPVHLTLDGNTLFFIVSTSPTDSKLISFNITTRTVNWESSSIGINLGSVFSRIVVSPSRVVVTSGTKLLIAFDRTTGGATWSKPGIPFDQPVVQNNIIYAASRSDSFYPAPDSLYGIYAFDAITGNSTWRWKKNIVFSDSNPFLSGNVIYYCGMKKDSPTSPETGFITALNSQTGIEFWTINTGLEYHQLPFYPIAVGNKVYVFKHSAGTPGSFAKLVSHDGFTGQLRDSIQLTGQTFGKIFIVGSTDKVYTPN